VEDTDTDSSDEGDETLELPVPQLDSVSLNMLEAHSHTSNNLGKSH